LVDAEENLWDKSRYLPSVAAQIVNGKFGAIAFKTSSHHWAGLPTARLSAQPPKVHYFESVALRSH